MVNYMFTKNEVRDLLISILVLTFIFAFDDQNSIFIFEDWILNFLEILIIILIVVLFRELVIKFFASRHEVISEYRLWNVERLWFGGSGKLPFTFPFGVIASLILTVVSRGNFYFTAIGVHNLTENKSARTGRKKPGLSYFEEMQIACSGIFSTLVLAIIFVLLGRALDFNITSIVNICFFIVLFNMIPLSDLDGAKIFFGSILTYIFLLVFIIAAFVLMKISIILALVVGFILAILITLTYFYKVNYK